MGLDASIYTGGLNNPGESVIPRMKTKVHMMRMHCVISGGHVIQHEENGIHRVASFLTYLPYSITEKGACH